MKKRWLVIALLSAFLIESEGVTPEKKKRMREHFLRLPLPEWPAQAANVVKEAPAEERSATAAFTLETLLTHRPSAAPAVVAAIVKVAPETRAVALQVAQQVAPAYAASLPVARASGSAGDRGDAQSATSETSPQGSGSVKPLHHPGHNPPGGGPDKGQGDVGHGPPPGRPSHGRVEISDRPIQRTLPNGKERHFPPDPPRRPVDPPRPIFYNRPPVD